MTQAAHIYSMAAILTSVVNTFLPTLSCAAGVPEGLRGDLEKRFPGTENNARRIEKSARIPENAPLLCS